MDEEKATKELSRCLQKVFDSIPRGRKPFPMQEASFVETCARLGIPAYVEWANKHLAQEKGE